MPKQSESKSDTDNQWVSALLEAARQNNQLVAGGVFDRLELMLNGQISERDLTLTNLRAVANQLIEDMLPEATASEETQ